MAEDVFISYAREEMDAAKMVRLVLERNGISCWMDVEGIDSGDDFGVEISAAIRACKAVVFILSARSQRSQWTRKEVTTALNFEKPIFPIAIEKCDVIDPFDFYFSNVQRSVVYEDISQSLNDLVHDIKAVIDKDEQASIVPQEAVDALTSRSKRTLARRYAPVAAAVLAVVVALALVIPRLMPGSSSGSAPASNGGGSSQPAATVYASDCFYYNMAGNVTSTEELGSYAQQTSDGAEAALMNRAFSILSFVRNEGEKAAQVESVTFEVLELEPIEEPDLQLDVAFHDDVLLVYSANNGWGSTGDETYDFYLTDESRDWQNGRIELSAISSDIALAQPAALAPGEVRRELACTVDVERFKELGASELYGGYALWLFVNKASSDEEWYAWMLTYDDEQGFGVQNGPSGAGSYSVTLFAVLDVDARPTSIRFTGEEATPRVEDTYRIETVIAPTKSCYLRCKDVYSVNGELQETPEYEVITTVPVFTHEAFGISRNMTLDLAADPDMKPSRMQEIADSYRYDPRSILEDASDF